MSGLTDRNWSITYTGTMAVLALVAGFLYMVMGSVPYMESLILAGIAGIIFAITSRLTAMERFQTFGKPLSGFLAMISGTLLVASVALFAASSVEVLTSVISSGESFIGVARSVVVTIMGLVGLLLGTYLTVTGSSLVVWDRLDSKVPVGPGRSDLVFTAILAAITVFSVFGTAIIKQVSLSEYLETARTVLVSADPLSGVVSGFLLIMAYIMFSKAWGALPIRESVPRQNINIYDRLAKLETVVKWLLVPVVGGATAITDFADLTQLEPLLVLTTESLRQIMLQVILVSLSIIIAVKLLQLVTGDRSKLKTLAPYFVFGAVAYIAAPYLTGIIDTMLATIPEQFASELTPMADELGKNNMVLALMTFASGTAFILKTMMGILRGFGIIPRGLEGTTLAATGIFMTSIGVHIFQPSPSILFTGVAVSMVVWEIGKRSTILGREVGKKGSSLQAETVQVISKVVVAAVAVLVARTLLVAVRDISISLPEGPQALIVFLLSALGVTLIAFSLKEYT